MLVEIFWANHDQYSRSYSTQYANILFYHDERQKDIAEETKEEFENNSNKEVHTDIRPIGKFYPAETYHQKYRLRQSRPYINIMNDIYPDDEALRDSTAAARLNGILSGYGEPERVSGLLGKLGLTESAREKLRERYGLQNKKDSR